MKYLALVAVIVALAAPAFGVSYTNNFDSETAGSLPTGWVTLGWGSWAPGPVSATVAAAPGGGQALKIVFGTDWVAGNYTASSGEANYQLDMTGIDGKTAKLRYEFDFLKQNFRTWSLAGDNTWFPPAAVHMNDNPNGPGQMYVGQDATVTLLDVPSAWVHVVQEFDAGTNAWTARVSYASGSGGGTFTGTNENDIIGDFFYGGWAFQTTMDDGYGVGQGVYENAIYVDNVSLSIENTQVPEPTGLLALASGLAGLTGFAARKRR